MKFIGFILEKETGKHKIGISLKELTFDKHNNEQEIDKILAYLKEGKKLMLFVRFIFDEDNKPIGPYIIYSDGKWIWPSYYPYYIEKFNLGIPKDFYNDMQAMQFIPPSLSSDQISGVEKFYMANLG